MAKSASLVTSVTYLSTFSPTYSSRNNLDPRAALKCLWPSRVMLIAVSLNTSLAACSRSVLMINQHFVALGK